MTDLFIIPAEVRRDNFGAATRNKADQHDLFYAPTTLVMSFPPGELEELRRLLNGDATR